MSVPDVFGLLESRQPATDRVTVPASALEAAREVDASTTRRRATPLRKCFVRSDDDAPPPMTRIFKSGGRGGQVALKLYLALIWRCSSPPFETTKPARAWATLLGLEDPGGNGQRRVNAALRTLQEAKLVRVVPVPGIGNKVVLLDDSASTKAALGRRASRQTKNRSSSPRSCRPTV